MLNPRRTRKLIGVDSNGVRVEVRADFLAPRGRTINGQQLDERTREVIDRVREALGALGIASKITY
jgi:hypothetical protein